MPILSVIIKLAIITKWKMTEEERNKLIDRKFWNVALPFLTIICFIGSIALWISYFRKYENYNQIKGIVTEIQIVKIVKMRDLDYPLKIQLKNNHKPFYISDNFSKHFKRITNKIDLGDTILILFDKGIFDVSSKNNIVEISKNENKIFDFKNSRENNLRTVLPISGITILLGFLFLKRKKNLNIANTRLAKEAKSR